MGELLRNAADIIKAAAQSSFGIAALIIIVSGVVGVILFRKEEKSSVRIGVFTLLFVGLIGFGLAILYAQQIEPKISPTTTPATTISPTPIVKSEPSPTPSATPALKPPTSRKVSPKVPCKVEEILKGKKNCG
jgi:hypothetical protein